MSRRIDIELTSSRPDGTWTWRAAGAREPRGDLDGALVPEGAVVGTVLRVDVDTTVDGIEVVGVVPSKQARAPREQTLELLGSGRDEPLVTSTLVTGGKGRRGSDGRSDHKPGRDRSGRARSERDGDRRGRDGDHPRSGHQGERSRRGRSRDRSGGATSARPERRTETGPAAPRLRAGRSHRNRLLADLPAERRPLAELVLRGGVPAVRQVVERQHTWAATEKQPRLAAEPLLRLAEALLPKVKVAEWQDKAEAALVQVNEVDLRDLRSVVSASESAAQR